MKEKQTPERIFAQYDRAVAYNQQIDLYQTVRQNENFFIGNQWEGVNAPDLDKPVINILKRVVLFFVSSIVSDDISADLSMFGSIDPEQEQALRVIRQQIDRVIEKNKVKDKNRTAIRNAAVDGDACFYLSFNPRQEQGGEPDAGLTTGDIEIELIDNTNVFFGNPEVQEVQKQPYLILMLRREITALREELRKAGMAEELLCKLRPDDDPNGINREQEQGKVTVLVKFWRENGSVWVTKVARDITLMEPVDTGYHFYPVAYMSWDTIKNRYHGQAAVTGLIPNQIFINKLFAMCMEHVKKMAFPKVIYNKSLFPNGFSNKVGEAVGAAGDPNQAILQNVRPAEMSGQVLQMIEKTIGYTRDMMGASDASLGNVSPDNTSAIIAVQKASSMPLELNKMAFYQFVEDYVRIMIDMMRANFGVRMVRYQDENGAIGDMLFDFSGIDRLRMQLNVNIGAATYWSELMQVQTIDNLFAKGIITDAITYLESIPDGYIRNKAQIVDDIKRQQEQKIQPQQMAGLMPDMGGDEYVMPQM